MYSARGSAALPALGFPIRESTDHRLFSVSPWLIAAVHALLRLLVPRHPPCALLILTVIRRTKAPGRKDGGSEHPVIPVCWPAVQFSRSAEAPPRRTSSPTTGARRHGAGLSKLNSMRAAPPAPSHSGGSARRATSAGPIDISVAGGRRPRPQTTGIGGVPGSRYASTGAVQPLQVLELP